uniref:Remorin C-terminal domain-containing protein n=1 Tax=Aegilops tauschii subsp. strangulata TaxID=200361 RepID=A0A453KZ56_AEGTS
RAGVPGRNGGGGGGGCLGVGVGIGEGNAAASGAASVGKSRGGRRLLDEQRQRLLRLRLDEEAEFVEDSAPTVTPITSRKDTATQTSPDLSRSSSPSARPSFVRSFSMQQAKERESCFSDLEIRDVQMDERVSLTRWSKKHVTQGSNKNSTNMLEWNKRTVDSKSSSWESSETKCTIKVEREEAKLTAWENLQKAKAEAAIQKLVMKLEKKRSFSLDRILNTLRSAQRKAQGM